MIYDSYAPIYDTIGQGAFAEALVRQILLALPAQPRTALDLACGTGAAAIVLALAGARVVGVDRSTPMLAIARAKARDQNLRLRFVQADIRRLPIGSAASRRPPAEPMRPALRRLTPASFDLVTCLYDSLNYLVGDDDLAAVCAGVARLLRPGGHFVFDLNTMHEFASWDETDQVVYDSSDILVYNQLSYDAARHTARGRIVWFVRELDRWWRGEEVHEERVWSEDDLRAALAASGLSLIDRRTPAWEPAADDAPRVVYVAVKP